MDIVAELAAVLEKATRLDEECTERSRTIPKETHAKFTSKDPMDQAELWNAKSVLGINELDFHRKKLVDLQYGLEGVMACTLATTIEGALAQLALADAKAAILTDGVGDDEQSRDFARQAHRLISSAVVAIEAATGSAIPEGIADYYMQHKYSPFTREREGTRPAVEDDGPAAQEGGAA
jgi:hypothetical protein